MAVSRLSQPLMQGLDGVLERGARPGRVATGFHFLEGPSWHAGEGVLYFSDIIGDAQYRWSEPDGVSLFRAPSHMANGTTWDREGRLLVCEHASSRVSRVDLDGHYEVLASHFERKELNSPNDIVVKSDGSIWFTDPPFGRTATHGVERPQQLDFQGVFRLGADGRELRPVADDFARPNGLCFSLDESLLFVNDTQRQHIRVFDVAADGSLRNGRLWADVDGDEPGVADGMKVDREGNLYCCGSGGIHVFDPGGVRLGVLGIPEVPANFTWGGPDRCELLVTARRSLYRLRMRVPGPIPFAAGAAESARTGGG